MAIDLDKGERKWWLQPFPHDPYDYDCNWSGILIEHPELGKVYTKGCKDGILYMMDALTGEPIWTVDAHEEIYPGAANYHLTDPFSFFDLREWKSPDDGTYHTLNDEGQITLYPSWLHGTFGTDKSYDGEDTLYHYAQLAGVDFNSRPLELGVGASRSSYHAGGNVSIVARDVVTGDIQWTWFYPFSVQRSHMVVTEDIVFSGFTDGTMKFFDKDNGDLLDEFNVGSGIYVGPTIGKDSDGESKIFVAMGGITVVGGRQAPYGGGVVVPVVPGTIMALGLSEAAAQTTTVTTTATTSTTVISTTASTITEETGLPAEVTYAAVAVAIIAIVAAAFLMMRKR
jgi:alcohol dehydrogenase (cytochrome c)